MIHPLPLPPKEPNDAAEAGTAETAEGRYRLPSVQTGHGCKLRRIQNVPELRAPRDMYGPAIPQFNLGRGCGIQGGSLLGRTAKAVAEIRPLPTLGLNHAGFDSDFYESALDACPVARRYSGPGYALGMLGLLLLSWALLPLVLVALAVVWAWGRATGRGR